MKTPDSIFSLLGSIVVLAIVTTLVLPKRETANVATAGFNGFADSIRAAMGNK
jgi:L-aminopeptidase/D-esterase-like protein